MPQIIYIYIDRQILRTDLIISLAHNCVVQFAPTITNKKTKILKAAHAVASSNIQIIPTDLMISFAHNCVVRFAKGQNAVTPLGLAQLQKHFIGF